MDCGKKRKTKPYRDINELVSKSKYKNKTLDETLLASRFYGIIVRTKRAIIGPRVLVIPMMKMNGKNNWLRKMWQLC